MALSGCSRCLSVGVTAATPTIRRETVVQRHRELSVRRCRLKHPACFSKTRAAGTTASTDSHQPIKYPPHGVAVGCQALSSDSGSVSDPIGTADDAGQPVDTSTQPAAGVDWRELLWTALHPDSGPGQFACSGRIEQASQYPDITVAGVGGLTIPLSMDQRLALKAVAEQAPHGRGLETLLGSVVRDVYQVDASNFTVGPSWQPTLQSIVSEVAEDLDINDTLACNINALPYKLLLYKREGHFVAHQDMEKEPGTLATLVVELPCREGYTGGKAIVWHQGNTLYHRFDAASAESLQDPFEADYGHLFGPMPRSMRLALVYNLVWMGTPADIPHSSGSSPANALPGQAGKLQRALQAWEESIAAGCEQTRIAFMLDHDYTESNLGFDHLKGRDRSKWRNLAATLEGLETHFALVTRRIRGNDGYGDWGFGNKASYSEDESDSDSELENRQQWTGGDATPDSMKRDAVDKDLITAEKWVAVDGPHVDYGNINQQEFYNPDSTRRLFPLQDTDDLSAYIYLGNDGASTQISRSAALVLWPQSQTLVDATNAGFRALLPLLEHSLSKSGSGAVKSELFVASVLEACVQLLEAALPTGGQVFDEEPEFYRWTDHTTTTLPDYMNWRRQATVQECTVTFVKLGLKAAKSGIPNAAEMLQRVATAVEKRPDNYSLLKILLQFYKTSAPLTLPAVQQLVSCQIANLELMSWIQPFSWHMPEAEIEPCILSYEDNAQVNEFLQGPEESLTLCGYGSLEQAEFDVGELEADCGVYDDDSEPDWEAPSTNDPNYSFTAEAKAESSGACVVITKTKDWYMRQVEAKTLLKDELEGVRAMRR